jgi:hypothetical protein
MKLKGSTSKMSTLSLNGREPGEEHSDPLRLSVQWRMK